MTLGKPTNAKGCARLFLKHIYEKVGESGRSMPPLEYRTLANEIGLSDDQMAAALRQLRSELLIVYQNPTIEAFNLTPKGVQEADYLKFRQDFLLHNDPQPDSLEGVRAEIEYWQLERHRHLPRSLEWEQTSAKLDDLKHLENVMVKQLSARTVYLQTGAGSRLNVGSVDNSVNYVTISETNLFPKLRGEIETRVPDSPEKLEVLAKLQELEEAKGSPSYGAKFRDFISVSANLMTIIAPFIQPLSAHIK